MDNLTVQQRSDQMRLVASKNTRPEMLARRLIHRLGYRYRLHDRRLPGTPDLVFTKRRKVVFVHGCFWHRHDDHSCKLARMPKSRLDYWAAKLARNEQRDAEAMSALGESGWEVLTLWECELRNPSLLLLEERIRHFLGPSLNLK
jgi:DNA mismatch endonuclease (patch repair protein)